MRLSTTKPQSPGLISIRSSGVPVLRPLFLLISYPGVSRRLLEQGTQNDI
jgi:hypothetical protein